MYDEAASCQGFFFFCRQCFVDPCVAHALRFVFVSIVGPSRYVYCEYVSCVGGVPCRAPCHVRFPSIALVVAAIPSGRRRRPVNRMTPRALAV